MWSSLERSIYGIGEGRGFGFRSSLRYLRASVCLGLRREGAMQYNLHAGSGFEENRVCEIIFSFRLFYTLAISYRSRNDTLTICLAGGRAYCINLSIREFYILNYCFVLLNLPYSWPVG